MKHPKITVFDQCTGAVECKASSKLYGGNASIHARGNRILDGDGVVNTCRTALY